MQTLLHSSLAPLSVSSRLPAQISVDSKLPAAGPIERNSYFSITVAVQSTFNDRHFIDPATKVIVFTADGIPLDFPVTAQSTWLMRRFDDALDEIQADAPGKMPAYLADGTYDAVG